MLETLPDAGSSPLLLSCARPRKGEASSPPFPLDVAVFTVYLRKLPSPRAATFLPTVIRILATTAAGANDYSSLALLGTAVLEKLRNRWPSSSPYLDVPQASHD